MSLPFLFFVVLPFTELITFVVLGEVFGYPRVLALIAILSLLGIILFRLRPRSAARRPAKGVPPNLDPFFRRLGNLLLVLPGLISSAAGIALLFRPSRALCYRAFCRKFFPNGPSDLPMSLRLLAMLFGVNTFADSGSADSGAGRAWNPYGHGETDAETLVEDDDPDAATAYNGDLSAAPPPDGDSEIIDVDYTVR